MVKKYRKKPVVIEAVQWKQDNWKEIMDFAPGFVDFELGDGYPDLYIKTLEGPMHASLFSFIIKGVDGEFYPCREDIFYATYEDASKEEGNQDEHH